MTTASIDTVQAEFEAFISRWRPAADLALNRHGRYASSAVLHQWEVWQAAFIAGAAWRARTVTGKVSAPDAAAPLVPSPSETHTFLY